MSVGGDGTYLMAANNVSSRTKPVIGLNSCPGTSIGYLCLPKMYSADVFKTLSDIKKVSYSLFCLFVDECQNGVYEGT